MSTKTIRVSEEVYERLRARKQEGESFTDLLDRLVDEDRDIYSGFGSWTDAAEEMHEKHEGMEEEMEEDVEEFARER